MQETAALKRQVSQLRKEVKALMHIGKIPAETTMTTRQGTVIREGPVPEEKSATLSPRPKPLSQLWTEWMKGINGRLPAKDFSAVQQGDLKVKHVFCLRKPFWLLVKRLIDVGDCTSADTIDEMDAICSGSPAQQLRVVKRNKRLGGHWKLCPKGRGVGRAADAVQRAICSQ